MVVGQFQLAPLSRLDRDVRLRPVWRDVSVLRVAWSTTKVGVPSTYPVSVGRIVAIVPAGTCPLEVSNDCSAATHSTFSSMRSIFRPSPGRVWCSTVAQPKVRTPAWPRMRCWCRPSRRHHRQASPRDPWLPPRPPKRCHTVPPRRDLPWHHGEPPGYPITAEAGRAAFGPRTRARDSWSTAANLNPWQPLRRFAEPPTGPSPRRLG
jgi:hypothetical protein